MEQNVPARDSTIRPKIWFELNHTKLGELYLSYHIARQRVIRKRYKIATVVLSTSGMLGWKIWTYAPFVACGVVSIMQLLSLAETHIIPQEKESEELTKLRDAYIKYFNKVERLWIDYDNYRVDEPNAVDQFYKLREEFAKIEEMDSKLVIKKIPEIYSKADTDCRNYISQYH